MELIYQDASVHNSGQYVAWRVSCLVWELLKNALQHLVPALYRWTFFLDGAHVPKLYPLRLASDSLCAGVRCGFRRLV